MKKHRKTVRGGNKKRTIHKRMRKVSNRKQIGGAQQDEPEREDEYNWALKVPQVDVSEKESIRKAEETYFVLIPGSNLLFGKANEDEGRSVAKWQKILEEIIRRDDGEEKILKSSIEYSETLKEHTCGSAENKPYQRKKRGEGSHSLEQYNCVLNTLQTHNDKKKSIVCTSQGSVCLFQSLLVNPELMSGIDSIVLLSPAFMFPNAPRRMTKSDLKEILIALKRLSVRILLVDNEFGLWHYSRANKEYSRDTGDGLRSVRAYQMMKRI